ncbi:hypothetical protein [Leifsonia shinshuensis]
MPNVAFGAAKRDIRHESVEALGEGIAVAEQIVRGHSDDAPAFGLEEIAALDVRVPLPAFHAVTIALVLEREPSLRDGEVRMQHDAAATHRHGMVDLQPAIAASLQEQAQQRLGTRIRSGADTRERPGTSASPLRASKLVCGDDQFVDVGESGALARADQMVSHRDEVLAAEHSGELAPDVSRRTDRQPLHHLPRQAPQAVTRHSSGARRRSRELHRNVKWTLVLRHRQGNAEEGGPGLMAEVCAIGQQREVRLAPLPKRARRRGKMNTVERAVEVTGAQP